MPSMVTESSTSRFVASKPTSGFKSRPYSMCVRTARIESSRASTLTTRLQGWRTIARVPPASGGRSAHQIEADAADVPNRTPRRRSAATCAPGATLSVSEPDRMSLRIPGIRYGARTTRRSPDRSSAKPLLHGEDPDRAALGHVRIFAGEDQIHASLHFRGIDTPARLDRDILLAVDLKRYRHRGHARPGREFPQDLAGLGIEGAEHSIVGAAREQKAAAGGEHGAPVERRQVGGPHLFSSVDIPRLQLANVVGAGNHLHHVFCDSHEALALHVFGSFTGELGAQVVVGGDVEQARLRAVGDRRPIFAAPQARAELGGLVGAGLARLIDIRPTGFGIETLEDVLAHVGLAGDEVDLVVGALELPEVTVARDVHEA